MSKELTRRETLKLSGLALGGLAMAGIGGPGAANAQEQVAPPSGNARQTAHPFYKERKGTKFRTQGPEI
jgi:hypothetical protein